MKILPAGILLAAGQSQRFGCNKLLYPVQDDIPMLFLSAEKLARVLPGSIAVISEELEGYVEQLNGLGINVVVNRENLGIGSSIACGVYHSQGATGWMITLADMPYIRQETILMLAEAIEGDRDIVAPLFGKQRGHPVVFSQDYRPDLLELKNDEGARCVIEKYRDRLRLYQTNDAGVIRDVDYKHDLNIPVC